MIGGDMNSYTGKNGNNYFIAFRTRQINILNIWQTFHTITVLNSEFPKKRMQDLGHTPTEKTPKYNYNNYS